MREKVETRKEQNQFLVAICVSNGLIVKEDKNIKNRTSKTGS